MKACRSIDVLSLLPLIDLKGVLSVVSQLINGSQNCETPAGVRGRVDPAGAERRGGSRYRPRKASSFDGHLSS